MAENYCKRQVLYIQQLQYRLRYYKTLLLALCLFTFAVVIGRLTSKTTDESSSPNHVREGVRYFAEIISSTKENLHDIPRQHVQTFRKRSIGPKHGLDDLSPHMRKQVEFLRDAIKEAHHYDLLLAKEPKCKGDLVKGEVEDILCIPRPHFIEEVRNPCWWENLGNQSSLRCIPYFHILGCEKCGSSDLWDRIMSHPHTVQIDGVHHKEANWWGWGRYGRFNYWKRKITNFSTGYTDFFKNLTQQVQHSLITGGVNHTLLVTGDGTPSDLCDFDGWTRIAQNRGRKLPQVLTPHLMKHIYPETTKFIVIMREPIERLYSDYCFVTGGLTPAEFHANLLGAIDRMTHCIRKRSVMECFFDVRMYRIGVVRLHLLIYTLYIREWLKVLPRERFLFLKTEDYANDIFGTVAKCYEFLNLEPMEYESLREVATRQHSLKGRRKLKSGPMWRSTKEILEEILRPSMHFLPELLGDDSFTWNFNLTPVTDIEIESYSEHWKGWQKQLFNKHGHKSL